MAAEQPLSKTVKQALNYLLGEQQADGNFLGFSSPDPKPFKKKFIYNTTFTPAIILGALAGLEGDSAVTIRSRLAEWLLKQKGPDWSFNYWAAEAPEREKLPYPDDLDDTFCALAGLYSHDQSLVSGEALGRIIKLLIAAETEVGGPYRTWLAPQAASQQWNDVDLVVNCNVAYFLSLVSNPLPNLTKLMERAIKTKAFSSPYYPSEYPVLYFLARAYQGPRQKTLIKHILGLQKADGTWGTPLQTALMITALQGLGHTANLRAAQAYLVASQKQDGSWGAEAFCLDPARNKRQCYSGAPALTTSLVLEALGLPSKVSNGRTSTSSTRAKSLQQGIVAAARKQFSQLGQETSKAAIAIMDQLVNKEGGQEIVLLPQLFYESLSTRAVLDSQVVASLGLANLYGWIAYTIYDDFLDDEGRPELLGAANASLRYSLRHFEMALPRNLAFKALVDKSFDAIDSANTWEVRHCRLRVDGNMLHLAKLPNFGDLGQLADRSLGHTLTPLAVLVAMGEAPDGPASDSCLQALRHYLVARQLNDDLHDWEADVVKGCLTYVVVEMLRALKLPKTEQDLRRLLPVMRQQFWHLTLPQVVQTIADHVAVGRQALVDHPLLKTNNAITVLLDDIEAINAKTMATVADAEGFLSSYRFNK